MFGLTLLLGSGGWTSQLPTESPELVGMSASRLQLIEHLVEEAIRSQEVPGAVVMVARRGRLVYSRAFGMRVLEPAPEPLQIDAIFDVASLTKVMATAASVMILVEDGKLILSDPVAKYIPEIARRGKGAPILILGESGAGKERLAQFIHQSSPWAAGPFVPINCANLSNELADSVLFGYYAGAFSGAPTNQDTPGYFHQAQDGTLVLDEIAELPLNTQPKLLRALHITNQGDPRVREIQPVGRPGPKSTLRTKLGVLVIGCTNRYLTSLREDVIERFRQRLTVPPLDQRPDDVVPLANYLLGQRLARPGLKLSRDAEEFLKNSQFPGNVRTLERLLEIAAQGKGAVNILSSDDLRAAWPEAIKDDGATRRPGEGEVGVPSGPTSWQPPAGQPQSPVSSLPEAITALLRCRDAREWEAFTIQEIRNVNEALKTRVADVVATLLEWALTQSPDVPSLAEYLRGVRGRGREPQDVVKRWLKLDPRISKRAKALAEGLDNQTLKNLINAAAIERSRRTKKKNSST